MKYGKKASDKLERAMHERKRGTLKSGRVPQARCTSRKQGPSRIQLPKARQAGAKRASTKALEQGPPRAKGEGFETRPW